MSILLSIIKTSIKSEMLWLKLELVFSNTIRISVVIKTSVSRD